MQNLVNLIYREEEREMIPLCRDQGVGLIPWSPMARGRLARPRGETSIRLQNDVYGSRLFNRTEVIDGLVIDAVEAVAHDKGRPMAQVALAWVLAKPEVSAPIVGATRPEQLDDAVAALDVKLSEDEIARLEAPYEAHRVIGFV